MVSIYVWVCSVQLQLIHILPSYGHDTRYAYIVFFFFFLIKYLFSIDTIVDYYLKRKQKTHMHRLIIAQILQIYIQRFQYFTLFISSAIQKCFWQGCNYENGKFLRFQYSFVNEEMDEMDCTHSKIIWYIQIHTECYHIEIVVIVINLFRSIKEQFTLILLLGTL